MNIHKNAINYVEICKVNPNDFIDLLNSKRIREHLIDYETFNSKTIKFWIKSKEKVNATKGCKIRAIICNNQLAGWCGIQYESGKYEIAIVINDKYWGIGKNVFNEIMCWAEELDHHELNIHLLESRPEYKFLHKISTNVYESEIMGRKFTTYQLEVKDA